MKTLDEQVLSATTGTLDRGVRCMGDCPPGVEVLHRLPTLEVVHARRIQRVGGDRQVQTSRSLASAADEVPVRGHVLVPLGGVDLEVAGDDHHGHPFFLSLGCSKS
jgi:hypothetical protein